MLKGDLVYPASPFPRINIEGEQSRAGHHCTIGNVNSINQDNTYLIDQRMNYQFSEGIS